MILTLERWRNLQDYVREYLFESAAASDQPQLKTFPRAAEHRWQHTLNVLKNAELILAGEQAELEKAEVVRAAVMLHDVSMFVCEHTVHGQVSAEIAAEYLSAQGYPTNFSQRVCRAVVEHGTDFGPLAPEAQGALFSWEGKVLVEADILDKLGAVPVAEALLQLGGRGLLAHETLQELASGRAMERAAFFKDYFWTATGKRLAQQRFNFFQEFNSQLNEEVYSGAD